MNARYNRARPKWIIARSWQRLAEETGVGFNLVKQTLERVSASLAKQVPELAAQSGCDYGDLDTPDKICQVISQRNDKVIVSFDAAGMWLSSQT